MPLHNMRSRLHPFRSRMRSEEKPNSWKEVPLQWFRSGPWRRKQRDLISNKRIKLCRVVNVMTIMLYCWSTARWTQTTSCLYWHFQLLNIKSTNSHSKKMELITFAVYSFYSVLVLFQDSFHSHCCIPDLISWICTGILHWSEKFVSFSIFPLRTPSFCLPLVKTSFITCIQMQQWKRQWNPHSKRLNLTILLW